MEVRGGGSRLPAQGPRNPSPAGFGRALLRGGVGPCVALGLVLVLAPAAASDPGRVAAIRAGGFAGVGLAVLVSAGVGLWTWRACARGGSAFLAPLAGGFLVKLAVLGLGTWVLYGPLRAAGDHVAFALAFVAAAFGFQLLFVPSLSGRRKGV